MSQVVDAASLRRRAVPVDRSRDRLVVLVAIGVAVAFLVAALASSLLDATTRRGIWLPLHLSLLGAASSAIAGVMPFFSAAFAAAPPSDVRLRLAAVACVGLGALAVSGGVVADLAGLAVAGGLAFIAGIALTATATLRPLRDALGPSRGLITQGYVAALAEVGIGATIATLYVGGWGPVVASWSSLKVAHAWLNLVGFVSLVLATTLLHFFPTVVGARIVARPSARITVLALAAGPPLVALAFTIASDVLARFAAVVVLVGAVALATYAGRTWSTRARWTTDRDWHRFAIGGLVSAVAWFEIGVAVSAGRVLWAGAVPAAWSVEAVFGPLVVGWIALAILASATHLLPAVGPGNAEAHARQRAVLGRGALARLAGANVGIAALSAGIPLQSDPLVAVGTAIVGITAAATVFLIAAATVLGLRSLP